MKPMHASPGDTRPAMPSNESSPPISKAPMVQLAVEVYETASPATQSRMLTQLVGKVYETAPPALRSRLLQHLLRPLGLFTLVTLANGVFVKMRSRSDWQDLPVQIEDAQRVAASDLSALVEHVQQVSAETLDGLAQVLTASPWVAASAAAIVLVAVLVRHPRVRPDDSGAAGDSCATPSPVSH